VSSRNGDELRVALLGLGEAGGRIAADLVALGVPVSGWDPDPSRLVAGVASAEDASAAVSGAHVVLSVTTASAALRAAEDCASGLAPGALFADLSTAAPSAKVAVAAALAGTGVLFADVALMAPVPERGLATPALASGPGAEAFADRLGSYGMPVQVVGDEVGMAAERKLLRSVFAKGLAAAVLESLDAAAAAGCEEWLRDEIASTLTAADGTLLERLVEGSRRHAVRRVEEMEAACELLRDLGVEPRIAAGSAALLADLAARARA
jgi:3-hydroxyisobutyrate dehydrogenase-like beta-hydroxyacid dehydrogenase